MKTILLLLLPLFTFGQCFNDSCGSAINALPDVPYYFCNYDCTAEYYGTIEAGQWDSDCVHISTDQWFQLDYSGDGFMCVNIYDGNCSGSNSSGWQMQLYQNSCDSLELIWSTACYWMTDDTIQGNPPVINEFEYFGIGEDYDPHRQEWFITFDGIEDGTYYVQIDPFNTCTGCGYFIWCDSPLFLELKPEEQETDISANKTLLEITDVLGRKTKESLNTVLLYRYTDGSVEKRIIIE